MGSAESAGRTASFGLDEDERVRILRGVKLSEDVLQRMRGVANIAPERTPSSSSSSSSTGAQKGTGASRSSSSSSQPSQNRAQSSPQSSTRKPNPYTKEEQKRYEQKQKLVKEELAKMAKREREAFQEMNRQRQNTRQEAEKTKQLSADEIEEMVQQLQKKDSQLKALDAFYREQLAQLEKRNRERYEHSKEQFHQAAAKTEANVRARNTDPVCAGLQAQILSCYRENGDQTLRCSDLAKAYMQCISAAKKNILVNHG